jgi:hypothetical protein
MRDLDDHAVQILLEAVAKLNPWIKRHALRSGGEKVNGVRQPSVETVAYEVAAGDPVLIQGMEYLSQRIRSASGE